MLTPDDEVLTPDDEEPDSEESDYVEPADKKRRLEANAKRSARGGVYPLLFQHTVVIMAHKISVLF